MAGINEDGQEDGRKQPPIADDRGIEFLPLPEVVIHTGRIIREGIQSILDGITLTENDTAWANIKRKAMLLAKSENGVFLPGAMFQEITHSLF